MSAKSEFCKYLRIVAAAGVTLTACSLSSSNTDVLAVDPTPVSSPVGPEFSPEFLTSVAATFAPTVEARSTALPVETATEIVLATETEVVVLPTATETPAEVVTILGTEEEYSHQKITLDIPDLGIHTEFTLVPYYATNDEERKALDQETAPGASGNAAAYPQPEASLLGIPHSGWTDGKANPAEVFRKLIQGGGGDVATLSDTDQVVRMLDLTGREVNIIMNGRVRKFLVAYVQKLNYGAEVDKFRQDGNVALETAIQIDRDKHGGVSVLDSIGGPFFILNFCGWARTDQIGLDEFGNPRLKYPTDQWERDAFNIFLVEVK